jgi:MFS transporter, ACS family, tartrate transporter
MSDNTVVAGSGEIERSTMRKVIPRLGGLLFVVYIFNYLDRTNVGIAKLQLQPDLGLSEAAFGLGAGLFFVGYVLFEIPSNAILYRVGARIWIARIMFSWGLVSMAMCLARNEWSFYLVRFLLGVAEAGLVPGVLLYLGQWIPAARRARVITVFYIAVPISTVIGAPLSTWLMGFRPWGLDGWQFMFLVEGFPCLILAALTLKFLTNRPEQATWLSVEQRTWLTARMEQEQADVVATHGHGPRSLLAPIRDKGVLAMASAFFCMIIPLYALAFFLPTIVKAMGSFTTTQIGWLTAIPYVFTALFMWLISRNSDRTRERTYHYVVPAAVGVVGLVVAAVSLHSPILAMIGFTLGAIGCISTLPTFWTQAPFLVGAGVAAAGGIAFITAFGNIAGFVSPYLVALIKGDGGGTSGSTNAILVCAGFLVLAALSFFAVGRIIKGRAVTTAEPAVAQQVAAS